MAHERELDLISDFGNCQSTRIARLLWKLAAHPDLGRERRKFIRKRLAASFPGPFDRQVEGVLVRAYPSENYCDRIVVGRGRLPEADERALIATLLKPGMAFVDIGANIGTYSLFVARRCGDRARILAFEPHPRTFAKLAFNVRANGFASIEAINAGIGPDRCSLRLYSTGGANIGASSMLEKANDGKIGVEVKAVPLASALKDRFIRQVDLLKIDVEGFEDRALLPLMRPEFRALWPKAVLIETVHRRLWLEDCVERLEALGYRAGGKTVENLLLLLHEGEAA